MRDRLPRPDDPATFDRCRLDWAERDEHAGVMELHRDLLRLRRDDPVLRLRGRAGVEGAVLSDAAFVLRFVANTGDDRLLVVNLGAALHPARVPEPLLAPPAGAMWTTLWSSEDPRYGGRGTPEIETSEGRWLIPAEAAVLLGAQPGPPDAR
jgi:maltooligosyltrehalose trehalohydrolase